MRILIAGAGGVGGYLAAKLIAAGEEVAVLARGAHLEAIRARGLTLEDGEEVLTARPAAAADDGAALGPADLVIFAVKGQDLAPAIEAVRPAFHADTLALPFLNGVDAPRILAEAFGAARALIGIAHISVFIAAPGVIRKASPFGEFIIGDLDGRQDTPAVRAIIERFRAAGISTPERADVRRDLWQKFIFLTALAGTTAGARADIGTVRETPELWALFRALAAEALAVARAEGIALGEAAVDKAVAMAERMPGEVRASLAHDLAAGKPLETDWLNGAVVRLAGAAGFEAPRHETVAALLAPWKNGSRS